MQFAKSIRRNRNDICLQSESIRDNKHQRVSSGSFLKTGPKEQGEEFQKLQRKGRCTTSREFNQTRCFRNCSITLSSISQIKSQSTKMPIFGTVRRRIAELQIAVV